MGECTSGGIAASVIDGQPTSESDRGPPGAGCAAATERGVWGGGAIDVMVYLLLCCLALPSCAPLIVVNVGAAAG